MEMDKLIRRIRHGMSPLEHKLGGWGGGGEDGPYSGTEQILEEMTSPRIPD